MEVSLFTSWVELLVLRLFHLQFITFVHSAAPSESLVSILVHHAIFARDFPKTFASSPLALAGYLNCLSSIL